MAEIFTRFDNAQDIVSNLRQTVSSGMWSGGSGTLTTFFTSSTQSSSNGQYYYDMLLLFHKRCYFSCGRKMNELCSQVSRINLKTKNRLLKLANNLIWTKIIN